MAAIAETACRLAVEKLDASRAQFTAIEGAPGEEIGEVRGEYVRVGVPMARRFAMAAYGEQLVSSLRDGKTLILTDTDTDPRLSEELRQAFRVVDSPAAIAVPLVKDGLLITTLAVHDSVKRAWTSDEVAIVQETAERTWIAIERVQAVAALAEAEAALHESEQRQAFLLKLSDALRPLVDPAEVMAAASEALGRNFGVGRCGYGEMDATDAWFVVERDWTDGVMPSAAGRHLVSDFGEELMAAHLAGAPLVIDDAFEAARPDDWPAYLAAGGLRAVLASPLVKEGRVIASLFAQDTVPRRWTDAEVALARDVVERTWAAVERAKAEAALRESEERFAQFAKASSAGIWIRDAKTLAMEFVSPAIGTIYGVEIEALLGDIANWAAMIVPEDRDIALGHVAAARRGESVVHEFRIRRPTDGSFRWIRNTDFPLGGNGHPIRIGGIAEDITDAKLAVEHQGVLLAELQHRVRNIMALIRSITTRTGERAASVQDYTELMLGRLMAFARVQALLTRASNLSVGIASIVHDEVSVQAQHEGRYVIDGPDIELSPKAAEVLTLAVHELATNAVKYGALSALNGTVTVTWSTFEKQGGTWLAFDWIEAGVPQRSQPAADGPRRRGFGTELIEGRVPYELKGKGAIAIEPGGARCHLEFPLQGGASILETGAPQRATVFGGALDMTGEPDLSGHRILVVEDDYYLATDSARALQGAGAQVMGPCGIEEDALAELKEQRPDAVILDINLGRGASFKLAEHLKDTGIPFVFTTGYDQEVIPAEFDAIERLEKPFQLRQVVGAAARLVSAVIRTTDAADVRPVTVSATSCP